MIVYDGLTNLTWFMGIIEDVGDPTNNGRVKIRAFGFHPTLEEDTVSTDDLPWAYVLSTSPHMHIPLDRGELVFGAFLDGRDAQQPLVFGTIPTPKFGVPVTAGGGGAADSGQMGSSALAANFSASTPQEAFLNAVALKESGGKYDVRNGGSTFDINAGHPGYTPGSGGTSSASGRYQFTYDTWLELNNGVNAPMTKANQDAAAWKLAQQRYKKSTGSDLNTYIETNGVTPKLLDTLSPTWAAFGVKSNQTAIINAYKDSLALGSTPSIDLPPTNPYLKNTPEVIDNFGNKALPPQATGEDLHKTPAAAATTNSKTYSSKYGGANTPTAYTMSHPGLPVGGSYKTGVWNTRYDGSYIEMHAGSSRDDEHINVVHRSGSHIILDQNGNITINSVGRVHIATTNNLEEHVDGYTTNISKGGYTVVVDGGGLTLASSGDINITSNSNINFGAGGNIWMAAGGSVGVSAPKIGLTAEAGIISMLAGQNIALQSTGDITNKASNLVLNTSGKLGIKTTGDFAISGKNLTFSGDTVGIKSAGVATIKAGGHANILGTEIHMNDGGDVADATIITVPNTGGAVKPEGTHASPPPMGVGAGKSAKTNAPKPGSIGITDIDETGAR